MNIDRDLMAQPGWECACEDCISMCHNVPCRGTPDEIEQAIEAGYGDKLCARRGGDLIAGQWREWYVICPATAEGVGKVGTYKVYGTCLLLTENELCPLHGTGFKPAEARLAGCGKNEDDDSFPIRVIESVEASWDTIKGRRIADAWIEKYGRPA